MRTDAMRGFFAVCYKEVLHMRRDSLAVLFALIMPLGEMVILGYAIDTNVRQLETAVYDESGLMPPDGIGASTASRAFLERLQNSDTFHIARFVGSDAELNNEMVAGRARVGIKIPVDFDRNLQHALPAQVMVMVDGSESSVAGQAVNVATSLALDESLRRIAPGLTALPLEVRPKVMFNPDSRSPNFFLPGLITVMLLMATTTLTAFSVVREKERGTLEQLMVTPVRPLGLLMGKIMPYFGLGLLELVALTGFMRFLFRVPIHGNFLLLVLLSTFYLFVNLALGILISVRANSQAESLQAVISIIMPSIFLSGYIFPIENMPTLFRCLSYLVPATYMMDTFRGVVLRGAGLLELWPNAVLLMAMGVVVLYVSARRFGRMVA